MDSCRRDDSTLINEIRFPNSSLPPILLGQNVMDGMVRTTPSDYSNALTGIDSGGTTQKAVTTNFTPAPASCQEDDLHDDCDFSDEILRYIRQILMEEDVDDKNCMLQDSLELQAAEKSFREVIGSDYHPPPADRESSYPCQEDQGSLNGIFSENHSEFANDDFSDNYWRLIVDSDYLAPNHGGSCKYNASNVEALSVQPSQFTSGSANSTSSFVDKLLDSPMNTLQNQDLRDRNQSISLFMKAAEEASKLISNCSDLIVNSQANGGKPKEQVKDEREDLSSNGLTGRKHLHVEVLDVEEEEERSSKQAAVYQESDVRSDMFDEVLLFHAGDKNEAVKSLQKTLQSIVKNKAQSNGSASGVGVGGRGRGRRPRDTKEVIDLRTLLISCAQVVAANDRRTAHEYLKQIRQYSSSFGDGSERLAACFADGLEARLAGSGSEIYKSIVSKKTNASDILKAHLLYLAACPFAKVTNFFSNKSIAKLTRNASRIHIIDFGILYGFQWPTFIQKQSLKVCGPPKIRITGIDFPQPGFRPAARVDETGQRLKNYAEEFKVPFEFNSIAKKWETIQPEDFKVDDDEVLIVNCIYRMKNLPDETMEAYSSRDAVLSMIRKLNPALFIHGIVNGTYNAPFFVSRFREALFHFSSHFDMLETVVPRENEERRLIERDILGKEALNVVACESWERIERPETYKQWQARNLKVGFTQLRLDPEIKEKAVRKVALYHEDFVLDDDSQWLRLGWKGRTLYALSTWQPQ